MMNWKGYGRKQSWRNLRYCLEEERKTTKTFSQDSRYPGLYLNLGDSEHEARC
jgi:hypothetical protein